jgi:hypothetical protein
MARAIPDYPWTADVFKHAMIVSVGKGRFLRRKGDPLRQSHDNLLAWAWFSLYSDYNFAEDIYNWAKWRCFVYDPHRNFSLDPRCILQPSHVFILKLAANKKPGWITSIWFALSCVVADHSSDSYLKSMLESDIVRARFNLLSKYKAKVVLWGLELLEKRREKIGRWYFQYYNDKNHPAVLATREV